MTYTRPPLAPGCLLVAAPALTDPNFARSVVYLLDHDDDGSMGVILNRATEVGVDDVLPAWGDQVARPAVVFEGGPVALDSALGLVRTDAGAPVARRHRLVTRDVSLVDLDADPDGVGRLGLRIFVGHAGWSSGQLEAEIAGGAWIVVEGSAGDPFDADPADLWARVLRRQPGPLAWLARFPADPSLN